MDKATVEHVSKLARLKLSDEEATSFARVMAVVLESFEEIANVDTEGVVPLVTPTDVTAFLREDTVEKSVDSDKLLEGAPEKVGRLFKVPPVV